MRYVGLERVVRDEQRGRDLRVGGVDCTGSAAPSTSRVLQRVDQRGRLARRPAAEPRPDSHRARAERPRSPHWPTFGDARPPAACAPLGRPRRPCGSTTPTCPVDERRPEISRLASSTSRSSTLRAHEHGPLNQALPPGVSPAAARTGSAPPRRSSWLVQPAACGHSRRADPIRVELDDERRRSRPDRNCSASRERPPRRHLEDGGIRLGVSAGPRLARSAAAWATSPWEQSTAWPAGGPTLEPAV